MIAPLDPMTRLSEAEAADYLGVRPETLRSWRKAGVAPKFAKVGQRVQYRVAWLDAYVDAHVEVPIYWPGAVERKGRLRAA